MKSAFDVLDSALDRTVVPGYSRLGLAIRRRHWPSDDPAPGALRGRTALVTGGNSGLGKAAANRLAGLGASVRLLVRDESRGAAAAEEIRNAVPGAMVEVVRCDVSDLDDVRRCAARLTDELESVDVLVHNAGVMPPTRTESPQGHEVTMATHVLGPVLLTELLLPLMRGRDARVVLVSSGGMYTQAVPVNDPDYRQGSYRGAVAYARSKRVQVALTPLLQQRWQADGVSVHAMHPGWADTPGVTTSLPTFAKVMAPLLRDADEGADTIVWLAATEPAPPGGLFWQDRATRPAHYRKATRETPAQLDRLWSWVRVEAGLEQDQDQEQDPIPQHAETEGTR